MKLRLLTFVIVALFGTVLCMLGRAQESADEMAAIRAGSDMFVEAFNKGDAKAIAALWTDDGEYIDDTGRRFVGRDAIEKVYAEFFTNVPKSKIQLAIDSLRLLSNDTAIEDGRAVVVSPERSALGFSKYTVVHVKVDNTWKMASVRDTVSEVPAAVSSAADLEFLIGTWVAEEHGVKTVSVCRWIAEGHFIERSYTSTHVDGTSSSGVQLVGWNPSAEHVQSWSFSPDGGYATGMWFPQPGGWVGHMLGTTGDGLPTSSINQFRKLDDNAYVWQAIHRSVGGKSLPDTHEVVWKRQVENAE